MKNTRLNTPLFVVLSLLLLLTGGCAVGPEYREPVVESSDAWHSSDNSLARISSASVQLRWWQLFDDPQLNVLMEKAAAHNLDVRIAGSAIREARSMRGRAASGRYPALEVAGEARRDGLSENGAMPIAPGTRRDRDYYEAGFDASWELDIFGHVARSMEAADARLMSRVEERRAVLVSVLAELARNYAELRGTQQRRAITVRNIALQQKTLDIVRERYIGGDASEFDVVRAEAQLRGTEAALPVLTADMRGNAYRIAVLTGQEPQALLHELLEAKPLATPEGVVPTGLRSDLLRRRPDVRAAERRLAAETADIGVATADLFPRFFLTGSAGVQSLSFGDVFESGSLAYALGPNIRWPIFRGGDIRARIRVEEAQAEAAALQYEKAVLAALEDAETALVRYGEEHETRGRLQKSVTATRKAVRLAQQRYKLGEDSILAVVDAERELARMEDEEVQSQTRIMTSLISLYKALGGGWDQFEPEDE